MGCVGKGCLILACFIVFLIIAGAIGLYFGTQTYSALLHGLSWANKTHVLAQEPSPVPQFETTDENVAAAERKWKDFKDARGQPAHVELTADDLNNLIAENRHARGKAFVARDQCEPADGRLHSLADMTFRSHAFNPGHLTLPAHRRGSWIYH